MNRLENILVKGGLFRLFYLLSFVFLFACNSKQERKTQGATYEGETMGTKYNIVFSQDPISIQSEIDSVLHFVNEVFSTYDTTSFISAYNHPEYVEKYLHRYNPERRLEHQRHFKFLMEQSFEVYTNTKNTFDPSAAKLFELWGFAETKSQFPSEDSIRKTLAYVGLNKYFDSSELQFGFPNTPLKHGGLNFNAIAKGYGVDQVYEYLVHKGDSDFMVEIGGEVRVHGNNPSGQKWTIGVNVPAEGSSSKSVFDTLRITNTSVATSGNYRNFYYDSLGNKIGHSIDPRTGYPTINPLKSVTVFHKSCAIADAYATAAMVLGPDEFREIIQAHPRLKAFLIVESGDSLIRERLYN